MLLLDRGQSNFFISFLPFQVGKRQINVLKCMKHTPYAQSCEIATDLMLISASDI